MKRCFGYIRVSTARAGQLGVSLPEQKDAIAGYAEKNGIEMVEWFEEQKTAAAQGRPVFSTLMERLGRGEADGVIVHKIDRSARNLKDWADLGALIDRGIDVHFANEGLDVRTRGGRLSADIQAVVAADYIRNLREEARKGFYGRLKQGIYPLKAPLGYVDRGGGKPKTVDPVAGALVKRVFELYATGRYSLKALQREATRLGLRGKSGRPVSINGLSVTLNNPFYAGIIRVKRTGEIFDGKHEPLISTTLHARVQDVLLGKAVGKAHSHDFLFRRLFRCAGCSHVLTGERQKGHIYYRCHTRSCPVTSVREEAIEARVREILEPVHLKDDEVAVLEEMLPELRSDWYRQHELSLRSLAMRLDKIRQRQDRLTDAYVDGLIDKQAFDERRYRLLTQQKAYERSLAESRDNPERVFDSAVEFLERTKNPYSNYISAESEEKRELLQTMTSNRTVTGKSVDLTLQNPFRATALARKSLDSGVCRDELRTKTLRNLLDAIIIHAKGYIERCDDKS